MYTVEAPEAFDGFLLCRREKLGSSGSYRRRVSPPPKLHSCRNMVYYVVDICGLTQLPENSLTFGNGAFLAASLYYCLTTKMRIEGSQFCNSSDVAVSTCKIILMQKLQTVYCCLDMTCQCSGGKLSVTLKGKEQCVYVTYTCKSVFHTVTSTVSTILLTLR